MDGRIIVTNSKLAKLESLRAAKGQRELTLKRDARPALRVIHNPEHVSVSSQPRVFKSVMGQQLNQFADALDRQIAEIMRL